MDLFQTKKLCILRHWEDRWSNNTLGRRACAAPTKPWKIRMKWKWPFRYRSHHLLIVWYMQFGCQTQEILHSSWLKLWRQKKKGERKKRGGWHLSLFWSIWPCGFNETELLCHFSTSSLLSFLPAVLSRAPHSSLPFCSTYFIELQCLLSSSDALLSVDWDHLWTSKAGHLLATIFQKSTWLPVSLHDYSYYCFFVGFSKAVFSYLSTIS